jgi:hypothetical protein
MTDPIRVMVERGNKKRVVAVAFDWPGWDRSAKTEEGALPVLDAYRPAPRGTRCMTTHT